MDISYQQQAPIIPNISNSNIFTAQNFDKANISSTHQFAVHKDTMINNDEDDILNILADDSSTKSLIQTQFSEFMSYSSDFLKLQNTFQQNMNNTTLNQLQSNMYMSYQNCAPINILSSEPKTIDNAILPQTIPEECYSTIGNTLVPNTVTPYENQSATVIPIDFSLNQNTCTSHNVTQMQNDFLKLKKIQIKCQPRPKFRPRTQNESKTSSHYLRCDEGTEQDYPTIYIPNIWACQSDTNIIEITLVDIEKQPHPYSLENKLAKIAFDEQALIFKRDEPNTLYFRLTNEDFLIGFKSFMIELIKCKQDHVITKNLIRIRKLQQSMLRFTRIYRNEYGKFERDIGSQEYSCIMMENYGDTSVEHMGPRYGPLSGHEKMFIIFKGRITKDDISIIISEKITKWSQEIKKITLNGNIVYFSMPTFPYANMNHIKADINIYFKKQKIHESIYLYMNEIDQELYNMHLSHATSNDLNHIHHNILLGSSSAPFVLQKTTKLKPKKRLSNN